MKIDISSKNYVIKDNLKELILKKVQKLDKYFDDDAEVKVLLKQENKISKFEISIRSKGLFFRSEVMGDDMYANLDVALPKVEKQVIKHGDKFKSKLKKGAPLTEDFLFFNEIPDFVDEQIVKRKTFELEPISVDDAKVMLDTVDNMFYVFLNKETNQVNILYRRLDGNYGLIDIVY